MTDRQKYLFDAPSVGEIAEVAARIIASVKKDHPKLKNADLLKAVGGKDVGVIDRLEDRQTLKVPASLITAIGSAFGAEYIQPYMDLMGLKAVPKNCQEAVNALPALTALTAKIAAAANGKTGLDHTALASMLTELREADGVISALRARAGKLGMNA